MNNFKEKRKKRIGEVFGDLSIIGWELNEKRHIYFAKCKCSCCNKIKLIEYNNLKNGQITGCGKKRGKHDRGGSAIKRLYNNYKGRAKSRNIDFNLTLSEFSSIIQKDCFYCNYPPSLKISSWKQDKSDTIIYTGIDRRDSLKGYYIDNCVPCCEFCNRAKNNREENIFIQWLNFVKNEQNKIF